MGNPKTIGFITKNVLIFDDLEMPPFSETSIWMGHRFQPSKIGIEYRTKTINNKYVYIYIIIYLFTGLHTYTNVCIDEYIHIYIFVCTIYYFYKIELTMGHHIVLS